MARDKKYTPEKFASAVERYFRSITRTVTAKERYDTGNKDSSGHQIFAERDILNDKGKKITYTEYVIPPSITALCLYLGITRDTFCRYAEEEGFTDTVTHARGRIEAYLEEQLLSGKKVQGIIFQLKNNYGWKDQRELELGDKTRETMSENMSLKEKMELVKKISGELEVNPE